MGDVLTNLTMYSPDDHSSPLGPDDIPDEDIKRFLWETGHFRNPQYTDTHEVEESDLDALEIDGGMVGDALCSWQSLDANLSVCCEKHHNRPPNPDGDIGPATRELMTYQRCAVPDYGPESGDRALGTGSWKGCNVDQGGYENFHSEIVDINRPNITDHWTDQLLDVLRGSNKADNEIGFHIFWREDGKDVLTGKVIEGRANSVMQFTRTSSGWIGLATVPGTLPCSHREIFNRYLSTWRGGNSRAEQVHSKTKLVLHECGHNKSRSHTNGGIMNPSLGRGGSLSWIGDTSESYMRNRFGGVPFPSDDDDPPDDPPTDGWPAVGKALTGVFDHYGPNGESVRARTYREFGG